MGSSPVADTWISDIAHADVDLLYTRTYDTIKHKDNKQ